MAQLVFEFLSSDLEAVALAVKQVIEPIHHDCQLTHKFLDYQRCASFDEGIAMMRAGGAVSVSVQPSAGDIRYALVLQPHFNGAKLPAWFGTIEYTKTDYEHIWDALLAMEKIQVVCLGAEEGVELDGMEHLGSSEFPWNDYSLILGAVRNSAGEWDIRRGPNYFPSK